MVPPPRRGCYRPSYHPEINIRYDVGGRNYEVWTYGPFVSPSTDRDFQRAIVDSFRVGATYPCWYDPDRPESAVLVREHAQSACVALVVPVVFLVFGGGGIRHVWRRRAKGDVAPG